MDLYAYICSIKYVRIIESNMPRTVNRISKYVYVKCVDIVK